MSIGNEIAQQIAEDVSNKRDSFKRRDREDDYERQESEPREDNYNVRDEWTRKAKISAAKKAINAFQVEDAGMLLAALDEIKEIDRGE